MDREKMGKSQEKGMKYVEENEELQKKTQMSKNIATKKRKKKKDGWKKK